MVENSWDLNDCRHPENGGTRRFVKPCFSNHPPEHQAGPAARLAARVLENIRCPVYIGRLG